MFIIFTERSVGMKGGTYILVVFGILIAKCMGFLRDIIFASSFGASYLTDMYFQIFGIASLVFTGIGGSLSTLIIKNLNKPAFSDFDKKQSYVSGFITKTALVTLVSTLILYIFSGALVKILLPGINDDMYRDALKIMYIMLPSCVFVIIAYIMSGVLQNSKVFFITSVMSLPYNVIIILSLFIKNVNIYTVSIATTIGWFLHIVVLMPAFYHRGYRLFGSPKKLLSVKNKNREVLYIFIGSMMFQLCFIIDKAAVSFDMGMASTVNYATNLFITISSVFVVAMSNVSYPSICRHYEDNNIEFVKKVLEYIITVLFAIFIPFILTVSLFGEEIIAVLYQRGEFNAQLTKTTAALFAIYSLGIFGCQELFNKVLYLASKYKFTVCSTLLIVISKPIINIFAMKLGGVMAVSATTTILFLLYAAGVCIAIYKVLGNYFSRTLLLNILKIFIASLGAFLAYLLLSPLNLPGGNLNFVITLSACAFVYAVVLLGTGLVKYILKSKDFLGENIADGSEKK